MTKEDFLTMKAIALCFKPYLKPEEALIYTNLGRTQLLKKCEAHGIVKNDSGYYEREALNRIMAGEPTLIATAMVKTVSRK